MAQDLVRLHTILGYTCFQQTLELIALVMLTIREHLNALKGCIAQDLVQLHAILGYTRFQLRLLKASSSTVCVLIRKVKFAGLDNMASSLHWKDIIWWGGLELLVIEIDKSMGLIVFL